MISSRLSLLSLGLIAVAACTPAPESAEQQTSSAATSEALTSVDDTWNQYTNERMGFSMKLPQQVLLGDRLVPLKVFENDASPNEVFIATTHWASYDDPNTLRETTWQDLKVANIAGILPSWHIVSERVRNDQELTAFLKKRYGKDCTIGERRELSQKGIYDVSVGNHQSPDTGDCFVNYITVIRYSPVHQKVIAWNVGQDATFGYDNSMIESFQFLDESQQ